MNYQLKIDNMVENIVKDYLNRLNDISKDKVIEQRCKVKIHNAKKLFKSLSEEKYKLQNQLNGLLSEVGKCLCGESEFTADMISDSIEATENELNDVYNCLNECERTLSKNSDILKNIEYYYNQCIGWAKDFDNSTLEQKKMIICYLITEIKIKRGYKIEIEFNEDITFNVDGEKITDKKFVIDIIPKAITIYNDDEFAQSIMK